MASKKTQGGAGAPETHDRQTADERDAPDAAKRGGDMVSKMAQSRAGIGERRRGQQMGDARSAPDKTKRAKEETPAARGRRKSASKFFADESSQQVASDGEAPRDNTPSVSAAIPTGTKLGESGGERAFKKRNKQ